MRVLIAAFFVMQAILAPRLLISNSPSRTIIIDHLPETAVGACLIFQSEDELIDGKPWAPRHCVFFPDGAPPSYTDDWDFITPGHNYEMWVEVYEDPDVTIESNHLHEAH